MPDREEHTHEVPDVVLRVPRPADLDALVRIDAQWGKKERRAYMEGRLKRALRPAGVSLARIAERDGEAVGFLLGEVTWGEFGRAAPVAWIDTVSVRRDLGRMGIGALLLDDFLASAHVIGAERVRTLLDPDDEELTAFLERKGFRCARTVVVEREL
jgi:predicted N-acetyltransferase YhbS